MSRISKTTATLASLVVLLMIPAGASGQGVEERVGQFCGLANDRRDVIASALADKRSKYEAAQTTQLQKTAERRAAIDSALLDSRGAADTLRRQSLELLTENQDSDPHRAAALFYAASVEAAVTARRTAFDAARLTFRQQVDDLHTARRQEAESQIIKLAETLDTAADTASDQCARSRSDRAVTRTEYIETLKSARLLYAASRQSKQETAEIIREYSAARNDAYDAAVTEFEQAMLAAREAFESSKAATPPGN